MQVSAMGEMGGDNMVQKEKRLKVPAVADNVKTL